MGTWIRCRIYFRNNRGDPLFYTPVCHIFQTLNDTKNQENLYCGKYRNFPALAAAVRTDLCLLKRIYGSKIP